MPVIARSRPRRHLLWPTAIIVAVGAASAASALVIPRLVSAPVDEDVQEALEQLALPSSPAPRAGDQRVGHDTYRTPEPCSAVQQHYGGTLSVFDTGWSTVFDGPYGQVGVVGADDDAGCRYLVTNGPTLLVDDAVEVPDIAGAAAFAVVACSTAPVIGTSVDFVDTNGTPRAVIIGGFAEPDPEAATPDAPVEASLVTFSGSSIRIDEPPDVTGIDTGTLTTPTDAIDTYVYASPSGARVVARCTPAVRVAVPTE